MNVLQSMDAVNTSVLMRMGRTTVSVRKVSYWTATHGHAQVGWKEYQLTVSTPVIIVITIMITMPIMK